MEIGLESFCYGVMFFDMNVSNTKSKNLVLVSPLKQNLNKIRNWLGAPELIMAPLSRGGVEDTRLEAKDKKKIEVRKSPSEDRPSRGQGQERSRPRPMTKDTTRK